MRNFVIILLSQRMFCVEAKNLPYDFSLRPSAFRSTVHIPRWGVRAAVLLLVPVCSPGLPPASLEAAGPEHEMHPQIAARLFKSKRGISVVTGLGRTHVLCG